MEQATRKKEKKRKQTSNNRSRKMLPLKAVLVSSGVVSMAIMLKLSFPLILNFLTSELPLFCSWLRLTPPYLYLLINCIIITIVASSKLQPRVQQKHNDDDDDDDDVVVVLTQIDAKDKKDDDVVVFGYVESPVAKPLASPPHSMDNKIVDIGQDERELLLFSDNGDENDKPPFSTRFGHRKIVKASPEGKTALRVSRPKKQETLGSTWRTITDGRSMPLTRHLRKAETFAGVSPEASPVKMMKKSDTFGSGNASPASGNGSGRLRKEPSLSQDELNRRVEAFIKKFNEEMRLQRQDSLNHYREMITRETGSQ